MAREEQQNETLAAKAAWPLLVLTAVLYVFFGLSDVAYLFMGVLKPASGPGAWIAAAMGGLQAIAAVMACVLAARRDLRGAILVVVASMMLGWLSMLPSVVDQGLDFHGETKVPQSPWLSLRDDYGCIASRRRVTACCVAGAVHIH